jgi:hypothetical protein
MDTILLKLVLTPLLIGGATLAGRRWGPRLSGWLVGLPFTSGPVAFFLALDHGTRFATAAAIDTLAGTMSQVGFCLVYARLAVRWSWPVALGGGCLAFAGATAVLAGRSLSLIPVTLILLVVLLAAPALMPRRSGPPLGDVPPSPGWDIPARMVVATALVLLLTGLAPVLGARLVGLLTPFPLYATVLTVFAQQLQGQAAGIWVLHGLLLGLFGFAGFFVVLAALLEPAGIGSSFAGAIATVLAIQSISLWLLRRRPV